MKIQAFTVATNDLYLKMAAIMIPRFEKLNGIHVSILDKDHAAAADVVTRPNWVTNYLWDLADADTDIIINVDADIFPMISLPAIPRFPFSAVHDAMPRSPDFNGGFFVARRESRPVFDTMKKYYKEYLPLNATAGQTLMTKLLMDSVGITWLSSHWNYLVAAYGERNGLTLGAYNLHYAGWPLSARLKHMEELSRD